LKISLTGPAFRNMDRGVGYGEASWNIYNSLKKLKVDVEIEAETADIEICFADPRNYNFNDPLSYKICYTAWESTDVSPTFKAKMQMADEIWATSDWVANVYRDIFPNKKIFTYKHGINEMWQPKLRKAPHDVFTFLHIGEPYSRKDAQLVVDCFTELFGHDEKYKLVLKCTKMNTTKVTVGQGWLVNPSTVYDNIVEITGVLSPDQMVDLYGLCDVFVYPSWGEGFGFQPLQAEASGMPSISTKGWADYEKYITFPLESRWYNSPWPDIHQGMMMKPEKEHLKEQMLNSVKTYKEILPQVFKNAFDIHKEYDWLEVTKPAVARLRMIYANILLEKKYFNFSELKKDL
jgi:glycosyltransferase involved in cell wall biosynthesis